MPGARRDHYAGTYQRRAAWVRARARSNPNTRCWRCGEPLATCGPNRNGRNRNGTPATWQAGHLVDSDPSSPLAPECSACNASAGATYGNQRRSTPARAQGGSPSRMTIASRRAEDPGRLSLSDSET